MVQAVSRQAEAIEPRYYGFVRWPRVLKSPKAPSPSSSPPRAAPAAFKQRAAAPAAPAARPQPPVLAVPGGAGLWPAFAAEVRPRYLRDLPLTYFSSVVMQELLAGARTPRQRRQVAALYAPFERVRRIITPSHLTWKEVGSVVAVVLEKTPQFRSKPAAGLLNDVLIALSGRSIGARVVTGNGQDFRLIQQFRDFALEIIDSESSAR